MSDGPKPLTSRDERSRAHALLPWLLVAGCVAASFAIDGCKSTPVTPTTCADPGASAAAGTITTMAGMYGDGGFRVGDGKCAVETDLFYPAGLLFGADSTLTFADLNNLRVRHVKKDGTVETIAGGGAAGNLSGPPKSWYLFHPASMLNDATGNVYLSLWHGDAILKLTPAGAFSILAGATEGGGSYDENALATEALLKDPRQLAWDAQGNIYYAEPGGHRVRMVDMQTGRIRTVAGRGTAGFSGDGGNPVDAELKAPYGVAIASDGTLYIADSENNRIRKVDPQRTTITTFAGDGTPYYTGDGGPAEFAQLNHPEELRFGPDGNLYVADAYNHCVRKIQFTTGATLVSTVAGVGLHAGYTGDGSAARFARLDTPGGIAFDPQGNLWISDTNNQVIRRVRAPF